MGLIGDAEEAGRGGSLRGGTGLAFRLKEAVVGRGGEPRTEPDARCWLVGRVIVPPDRDEDEYQWG